VKKQQFKKKSSIDIINLWNTRDHILLENSLRTKSEITLKSVLIDFKTSE
tara:strand:+ start:106 stop:255 length:150 start_codon:yes stop_codon:yes gene_type:complete